MHFTALPQQNVVRLRPAKKKTVLYLMLCAGFAVLSIPIRNDSPALAWSVMVFSGLGVAVFVSRLLPQAAYLEIRPEGFVICELFRRSGVFQWQTIGEFAAARLPTSGQLFVVFDEFRPRRPSLAETNKALIGYTSALPDTYGRSAAELARELNARRSRALAQFGS